MSGFNPPDRPFSAERGLVMANRSENVGPHVGADATARQRLARQWARRVTALMWLRQAVALAAVWLLAWGVATLALRVGWQVHGTVLLWGGLGLVGVAALAGWRAWRARPSMAAARSIIDRHNRAGGLVAVEAEHSLGGWRDRLTGLTLPSVRWRGARAWGLLALAGAFVAGAFLAPAQFTHADRTPPLQISHQAEQLDKQIETLKEQKLLDKQEARSLDKQLNQIKREAEGENPASTWESLDRIERQLSRKAKEAGETTQRQNRRLGEAEALARAVQQADEKLSDSVKRQAMEAMKQRMADAAAERESLNRKLGQALKDALKKQGQALNDEQLKRLEKLAKTERRAANRKMGELHQARLIDRKTLKKCKARGKCNLKKLEGELVRLSQNGKKKKGEEGKSVVMTRGGKKGGKKGGGKAGVSLALKRAGRGASGSPGGRDVGSNPVKMDGPASDAEKAKFEAARLPGGKLEDLAQSQRTGISSRAPEVNEDGGSSRGGAIDADVAGEGGASKHRVLPEHRPAVKRYFERTASDQ